MTINRQFPTRGGRHSGVASNNIRASISAVEIEFFPGPSTFDHVNPFLGKLVALLMFTLRNAKHGEFAFIPAGHEVQSKASAADVVSSDHLLGGDQRVEQRSMHGPEDRDALRRGKQTTGPGDGLQRRAVEVAAEFDRAVLSVGWSRSSSVSAANDAACASDAELVWIE